MTASTTPPLTQQLARWGWGVGLILAGTGHLTFVREEFRSQVPPWVPIDADDVVLLSGAVEISLGLGLLALPKERRRMSALATAFLVAVFPGNIKMALDASKTRNTTFKAVTLARLPLQLPMIRGAWRAGKA